MSEPMLGQIMMFGGNFEPRGWASCSGQLLPIASNSALFSILGTIYGGDGRTTFALPDLRGRVPVGQGHGPGLSNQTLGGRGGAENITLTTSEMPSHNHTATLRGESTIADSLNPSDRLLAFKASGEPLYGTAVPADEVNMHSDSIVVSHTGGTQPHYNMQPYLVCNYIIALQGIFPSRS